MMHITENPTYNDAKNWNKKIYSHGLVDEVYLVYTKFLTTKKTIPVLARAKIKLRDKDKPEVAKFMLYEPSAEEILII